MGGIHFLGTDYQSKKLSSQLEQLDLVLQTRGFPGNYPTRSSQYLQFQLSLLLHVTQDGHLLARSTVQCYSSWMLLPPVTSTLFPRRLLQQLLPRRGLREEVLDGDGEGVEKYPS